MLFLGGEKNTKMKKIRWKQAIIIMLLVPSDLIWPTLLPQDKFTWVLDCSLEPHSCPKNLSQKKTYSSYV